MSIGEASVVYGEQCTCKYFVLNIRFLDGYRFFHFGQRKPKIMDMLFGISRLITLVDADLTIVDRGKNWDGSWNEDV